LHLVKACTIDDPVASFHFFEVVRQSKSLLFRRLVDSFGLATLDFLLNQKTNAYRRRNMVENNRFKQVRVSNWIYHSKKNKTVYATGAPLRSFHPQGIRIGHKRKRIICL
jgi:hypothetical protein